MNKGFDFWALVTSRFFWCVAIAAIIALGGGIGRNLVRKHQIDMEVKSLEGELIALETKQDSLQALLKYIETPEFKEREARLRLGLKQTGEQVIIVPGLNKEGATEDYKQDSKLSTWRMWYNYFFSK